MLQGGGGKLEEWACPPKAGALLGNEGAASRASRTGHRSWTQTELDPNPSFVIFSGALGNQLLCEWFAISSRRFNQSWALFGRTDAETEAPILWPPDANDWFIGKDPDAGKESGQEEKRATEDEMVGWHHQFNGHELGQTLGDGEGQV